MRGGLRSARRSSRPERKGCKAGRGDHAPHWAAWLPHPLDSVARLFPATVVVLAILVIALALNGLIGRCGSP